MIHIPLRQYLLLFSLAMAFFAAPAEAAKLCPQAPAGVEGLIGDPAWMTGMGTGTGVVVRKDLNEPRWSAPLRSFQSDLPGQEGSFRIQKDETGTKLFVQFQTGADQGTSDNGDRVYFGISETMSTGEPNPQAKGVRFVVGSTLPTENPKTTGLSAIGYKYNSTSSTKWTQTTGVPNWVKNPAIWSKPPVVPVGSAVDWGIAFVVDLTALGIAPTDEFKVVLAMNVRTSVGVSDVYTPSPPTSYTGNKPFVDAFPVVSWQSVTPTAESCADGVTLKDSALTVSHNLGSTTNDVIASDDGAVNTFQAKANLGLATVPNGSLLAEFRIANWGTAPSDGAYLPIGKNDGSTAEKVPNAGDTWRFSCDANSGTKVCGLNPAPNGPQGIFARLNYAPGFSDANLPITKGSAYRTMIFQKIKEQYVAYAEIKTEGIETEGLKTQKIAALGTKEPADTNEIYLILHQRNMQPHQAMPVRLPYSAMARTKREFLSPQPSEPGRAKKTAAFRSKAAGGKKGDARLTPEEVEAALELPTQVEPIDELEEVWPHLEVQAYFSTKQVIHEEDGTSKQVRAMFPFSAFYMPLAKFYGFTQEFLLEPADSAGATLEVVQPGAAEEPKVLRLIIPKNKSAKLKIATRIHQEPLSSPQPKVLPDVAASLEEKKDCVESDSWCTYAPRGFSTSGGGVLVSSLLAALWLVRRRRGLA